MLQIIIQIEIFYPKLKKDSDSKMVWKTIKIFLFLVTPNTSNLQKLNVATFYEIGIIHDVSLTKN